MIYVHLTMPKAEHQARGSHEQVKERRYIGHHGRTSSLVVMQAQGIWSGSGARRMPEESRCSTSGRDDLKGYPWDVAPKKQQIPKDLVTGDDAKKVQLPTMLISVLPPQEQRQGGPKEVGPSDGCPGCTCIMVGGRAEFHTTISAESALLNCCSSRKFGGHRRKRRGAGVAGQFR